MKAQKIALFVNRGEASQRLATEALRRGHNVTAIVTDENEFSIRHPNLKVVKGDIRKKEDVKKYAKGHDVVIYTHEPTRDKPREHVDITRTVIEGVKESGVNHIVGAAHPFGLPTEGTEEAYNEFKPVVKAQQEALRLFQNEKDLHWGYAHSIEPEAEPKTGKYRASEEILFTTPEGENRIYAKGYSSAIIDEAENELALHENTGTGKEGMEY
jgi:putative NADH-flavin reductase